MKYLLLFLLPLAIYAENNITIKAPLRLGAISFQENQSTKEEALAIATYLDVEKKFSPLWSANVSLYAQQGLTQNTNSDFINAEQNSENSFAFLAQASLFFENQHHHLQIGRQQLQTPHADSDDIRMIPNLFEAYSYAYEHHFFITHISSMAGWENTGTQSSFIPVHQVFDIKNTQKEYSKLGMTMLATNYQSKDHKLNMDFYNYTLHQAINTFYTELSYKLNKHLNLGLQYDNNLGIDTFIMQSNTYKSYEAHTFGAQLLYTRDNASVTLASNISTGKNAPLKSLGGGAYYTSMEDSVIDAIGTKDARNFMLAINYELSQNLALSYAYGKFSAKDTSIDKHSEHNFLCEFHHKHYAATLAFAIVDHDASTGLKDFNQLRAFLDIDLI